MAGCKMVPLVRRDGHADCWRAVARGGAVRIVHTPARPVRYCSKVIHLVGVFRLHSIFIGPSDFTAPQPGSGPTSQTASPAPAAQESSSHGMVEFP